MPRWNTCIIYCIYIYSTNYCLIVAWSLTCNVVYGMVILSCRQLIPRGQQKLFSDILNNRQTDEDIVSKGLSRSTSFGEQLNNNSLVPNSAKSTSPTYR